MEMCPHGWPGQSGKADRMGQGFRFGSVGRLGLAYSRRVVRSMRGPSRPTLARELVRRQEFCHLAMGGLERLDGAVQIKIGVPDRCEKFSRQREIELDAGCAIAAFATVK